MKRIFSAIFPLALLTALSTTVFAMNFRPFKGGSASVLSGGSFWIFAGAGILLVAVLVVSFVFARKKHKKERK